MMPSFGAEPVSQVGFLQGMPCAEARPSPAEPSVQGLPVSDARIRLAEELSYFSAQNCQAETLGQNRGYRG